MRKLKREQFYVQLDFLIVNKLSIIRNDFRPEFGNASGHMYNFTTFANTLHTLTA